MAIERRRIYFAGHVQGVGFRFTTLRISEQFDVQGYVRNLADGRVELLAEGESSVLHAFQQAISTELADKVRNVTVESEVIDTPLNGGFVIAH